MKGSKMAVGKFVKYSVLSICTAALWLALCPPALGETLGEAVTTMEVQQELMGSESQKRIAEPNLKTTGSKEKEEATPKAVAKQQGIEKLEKAAQKLMQSLKSGKYDQGDFSAVWNTVIPKDTNFNDGVNTILKPLFEQYGKAEKLGEGKMAGVNRAVFPVQFTKGMLNMTVSLDPQDKIVEWTLLAQTVGAATIKDTNTADTGDFNDYKQEISRIDIEARGEESKWLGKLDKKTDLAKAMDDVVVAELKFLRKMADTEGSQKTVEAIDLILKRRQDRLAKLTTKLDEEAKTERRERRPPRTGGAGAGEQGQTGRPQRRTREPMQPANTNTNTNTEGQQQP
ncbi:MAG: hypothetical protein ABSH16_05625 [Sedimentisphaerales bacterium]